MNTDYQYLLYPFLEFKERPVVWNTYQCYLKAALSTISSEMEVVQSFGKCFGAKLVRGAYMDKERKLAKMKVRSQLCCVF